MTKKISVCFIFKGSDISMLATSVRSFLHQTHSPFEIIIVGPDTDLKGFKEKYFPNQKLIRVICSLAPKNEARNLAVNSAGGDFILRVDYDMSANANLLEKCLEASTNCDALIIP